MKKLRLKNVKSTSPLISQVVSGSTDTRTQFRWTYSNGFLKGLGSFKVLKQSVLYLKMLRT